MDAKKGKKPMLPVWLSPTQVRIIPVKDDFIGCAVQEMDFFSKYGFRVDIDDRDLSVSRKIRDAEKEWIPYIVVIGQKEKERDILTVRIRGGEVREMKREDLLEILKEKTDGKPKRRLPLPPFLSQRAKFR